jgi:uncharacterized alkaline shock family protein YloU
MKREESAIGGIKINNEVIAVIAGRAAIEVKGVAGMSGGVVDGLAKILGKKSLEKGVKVEIGQEDISIDLSIVVDYGVSIPDVCSEIQMNVKRKVEQMAGRNVKSVNVSVQGIHFPADEGGDIEEKKK